VLALGIFVSDKIFACTTCSSPWKKKLRLNGKRISDSSNVGCPVMGVTWMGICEDEEAEDAGVGRDEGSLKRSEDVESKLRLRVLSSFSAGSRA